MNWFVISLRENPELALFLTLALGFAVGRVRIGSFTLGTVVATLLAGVLVGQLEIAVAPQVKVVFFALFLFATGYKVGPQFFRALKTSALSQALLTLVLCVTSLVVTVVIARLLHYDCGTAAGLMAGAFTESTVIGTAGDTIAQLGLPKAETARLLNNIPVAYATTYLVGTTAVTWFLSSLAPRLLKVNLAEESRRLAERQAAGAGAGQDARHAYFEWDVRAYRVPLALTGRSVAEVERSFAGQRVFLQRLRRGDAVVDTTPETRLEPGDLVVASARRSVLLDASWPFTDEVSDHELTDFPLAVLDVVITRKELADRTLADLAAEHGRGVVLVKLVRGGEEIPFSPATVLDRGDLLRLSGPKSDVERAGQALGYIERSSSETDVIFLGLGILLGGLVGALAIHVGKIPLSLTASGGALVMGLVFGWLRSVRPTFGRIPEPALWVFDTIGLAVFMGVVGIGAGPSFVSGLRQTGLSLLLVGAVVAVVPHLVTVLFGTHVLKMNPVVLLGACAGAGTSTAALRAIQDEAQSKLPVLGYTVPYAIGNILLTAWGPVIVVLTR